MIFDHTCPHCGAMNVSDVEHQPSMLILTDLPQCLVCNKHYRVTATIQLVVQVRPLTTEGVSNDPQ